MFENVVKFLKKFNKKEKNTVNNSKNAAKERLHLVLMQDRANVSADFLELMKQEIIEVIKKYIEVDESAIDVRLTNKENEDGTNGAPALYANIPILNIKNEARKIDKTENKTEKENKNKKEEKTENKEVDNQKTENKAEEEKTENKETDNQKTETKSKENNSEAEENKKENENNNKSKKAEENKETKSENNKTKKVESEKKEKVKTEE